MTPLIEIIDEAVKNFSHELESLRFLPENRYNVSYFPTLGQYDWLAGQILYCLVRYIKPVRIIEVSTNAGYSGLFSALALKANNFGKLETFELVPEVAAIAQRNFNHWDVDHYIRIHIGDARKTAAGLIEERRGQSSKEILFLDSEHTEEFANFYLDAFLPDTHEESLFHMHDILPMNARVMWRPGEVVTTRGFLPRLWAHKFIRKFLPAFGPQDVRSWVKPKPFDVPNQSTEAQFGHKLSGLIPAEYQVFLYNISDNYPFLESHKYDNTSIFRCNNSGRSIEWNDSWWTLCGPLRKAFYDLKKNKVL